MHGGIDCCGNLYLIRPMEGNARQSWILDSTPWVPNSRYWIPFFLVELGLWFPMVSGILDSLSCVPNPNFRILDSTSKLPWIPNSTSKYFLDSLTWGVVYIRNCKGGWGCGPTPPLTFSDGTFFLITYFGFPDLSLTTQTRFSNLTILNTHKQRTDKLCLVAVTN